MITAQKIELPAHDIGHRRQRGADQGQRNHDQHESTQEHGPRSLFDPDQQNHREYAQKQPGGILGPEREHHRCRRQRQLAGPPALKRPQRGKDRQRDKEHRRHIDQHQRHLGEQVRHPEQQRPGVETGGFVPQRPANQEGQYHARREQQRGKNLDVNPVLARQAEDQAVEHGDQRQIGPYRDLPAPLAQEIFQAVQLDMLGLGEIPGGVDDDLGLAPGDRSHGKRTKKQHARRPAPGKRRPLQDCSKEKTGRQNGRDPEHIGVGEYPAPAGQPVVILRAKQEKREKSGQGQERNRGMRKQ